jgi:hypothetical protein
VYAAASARAMSLSSTCPAPRPLSIPGWALLPRTAMWSAR